MLHVNVLVLCWLVSESISKLELPRKILNLQMPVSTGTSPSASPSRSSRAALSLSPLQSPVEDDGYASYLENQLLEDMTPDDKWKVAATRAPKIPRKSPEAEAVSSPDQVVEPGRAQETALPTLLTSATGERPAAGESGAMLDALLREFEPSSGIRGEERGWGETLSHEAVEELQVANAKPRSPGSAAAAPGWKVAKPEPLRSMPGGRDQAGVEP